MKKQFLAVIILMLSTIVCSTFLFTGCDSVGSTSISDTAGLAKLAPEGTGMIMHMDIKKLRADKNLEDFYDEMADGFSYIFSGQSEPDAGLDDIDYFGMIQVDYYEVMVVSGNIDVNMIRESLTKGGYTEDTYLDTEIWIRHSDSTAIHGDILIIGEDEGVREVIKVIIDDSDSAHDKNADLRGILDKVPGGFMTMVTDEVFREYDGAIIAAMTFNAKDSETLKMTGLIKFEDRDSAKAGLDFVEVDMSRAFLNLDVSQDKEYVSFDAEMDMEEGGFFW
jgi:hypothetical protein